MFINAEKISFCIGTGIMERIEKCLYRERIESADTETMFQCRL